MLLLHMQEIVFVDSQEGLLSSRGGADILAPGLQLTINYLNYSTKLQINENVLTRNYTIIQIILLEEFAKQYKRLTRNIVVPTVYNEL